MLRKQLTSFFLVLALLLTMIPLVFDTQDYTSPSGTSVTAAYARDSKTGEIDTSGDGQVNFRVNAEDGYEIVSVSTDKNYKNLKDYSVSECLTAYRLPKSAAKPICSLSTRETAAPTGTVLTTNTRIKHRLRDVRYDLQSRLCLHTGADRNLPVACRRIPRTQGQNDALR